MKKVPRALTRPNKLTPEERFRMFPDAFNELMTAKTPEEFQKAQCKYHRVMGFAANTADVLAGYKQQTSHGHYSGKHIRKIQKELANVKV